MLAAVLLLGAAPAGLHAQPGPGGPGQQEPRRDRAEEWQEAAAFMKQYSPRRLALFQDLLDADRIRSERAERMRDETVAHFRRLRRLEQEDPGLYAIRLKRLTAEDAIFALRAEARDAEEGKQAAIRQKIREEVKNLVTLGFQEREHRIANLEKTLARERDRLAKDRERVEDFVERRLAAVDSEGEMPDLGERPGPGGGGRGFGPGPGPGPGPGAGPGGGPRGDRPPPPPPGREPSDVERQMRERRQRETQTTQPAAN